MDIKLILSNPKGFANSRVFKKHWPNDYELVIKCSGKTFGEQLYNYIHPQEQHVCVVCGRPTKFRSLIVGYSETCSVKCAAKNPARNDKAKATCMEKYGVDNPKKNDMVKAKAKATCVERYGTTNFIGAAKDKIVEKYGVENVSTLDSIKAKKRETMLEHWGVTNSFGLPQTQSTMLEKYGVVHASHSDEIRKKIKCACIEKFGVDNPFKVKEIQELAKLRMKEKYGVEHALQSPQIYHAMVDAIREKYGVNNAFQLATIQPNWQSSYEDMVCGWLDEEGIKYERSNRKILHGQELDIYIPMKNIAIEINGVYWHSIVNKPKKYHHEKFIKCSEQGIQLISLWEDWLVNKPSICKAIVLSKLGVYNQKVSARRCMIQQITPKMANALYNANHIQGQCSAHVHYGLFYAGGIISAMSFGKSRSGVGPQKTNSWELVRYCCKGGIQVVGGAGKLFKHFILDFSPSQIHSYSSNDISTGALYKALGFELGKNESTLSYWYVGYDMKRYHRYSFRKSALKNMGIDVEDKTETQIMSSLPYHKIFDSGTKTWIWKKQKED